MWSAYWVRSARVGSSASRATSAAIEADRGGHGVEIVRRAPVEVDPQELPLADPRRPDPASSSTSRSWPSAS